MSFGLYPGEGSAADGQASGRLGHGLSRTIGLLAREHGSIPRPSLHIANYRSDEDLEARRLSATGVIKLRSCGNLRALSSLRGAVGVSADAYDRAVVLVSNLNAVVSSGSFATFQNLDTSLAPLLASLGLGSDPPSASVATERVSKKNKSSAPRSIRAVASFRGADGSNGGPARGGTDTSSSSTALSGTAAYYDVVTRLRAASILPSAPWYELPKIFLVSEQRAFLHVAFGGSLVDDPHDVVALCDGAEERSPSTATVAFSPNTARSRRRARSPTVSDRLLKPLKSGKVRKDFELCVELITFYDRGAMSTMKPISNAKASPSAPRTACRLYPRHRGRVRYRLLPVLDFPPTVAVRHHALIPPRRPFLDRLPSPHRRKRGLRPFVPSLSLPAATRLRWRWLRNGPRAPMSPTSTTTRGLTSRRAPSRRGSCGAHSSTPTRSRRASLSSVISSHTTWSSWAPGRGSPEQPASSALAVGRLIKRRERKGCFRVLSLESSGRVAATNIDASSGP